MMSLESIQERSREVALRAAKADRRPFVVEQEDLDCWKASNHLPSPPFPFIGNYAPPGWEKIGEPFFVDTTGRGEENELALTFKQFLNVIEPGFGYAIVEAGEFQVYVGKFRKEG